MSGGGCLRKRDHFPLFLAKCVPFLGRVSPKFLKESRVRNLQEVSCRSDIFLGAPSKQLQDFPEAN